MENSSSHQKTFFSPKKLKNEKEKEAVLVLSFHFFLNLQFDDQAQAIHFAASYTLSLFMISPATDGAMIPRIGDPGGGG